MIPFRPINRSCCAAFAFLEREVGGTSSSPAALSLYSCFCLNGDSRNEQNDRALGSRIELSSFVYFCPHYYSVLWNLLIPHAFCLYSHLNGNEHGL
jgi:hypothetical protein